ncbi:Sugar transporter STL1 [Cyphellophora attinorum]|uniref:Sugar transporter STL1 n=1 Tax=Cyphellophora attinorum TaxID=1664694 RepID=A0A0N0NIN3_9EURO|nr:Sugar transporter STL1 [Phialophora attinorum]KPI35649.1 Sugar transporter STL1 [Phialophora attinorum]
MARQPFLGLRGTKLNTVVMIIAGVEFLLFGYDQGVMGGLITLPSFTQVFPEICTTAECTAHMTPGEKSHRSTIQGITIACYNLGCFTGALLAMRFGNYFGRRLAILIGCTIVSIGAVLQFSAFGLTQLIVGRVICGMGTGINTSTVPAWQAETTKPHQRGPVIAFEASMVIAGVALSYWIDFGFSYVEPSSAAWRAPVALQLIFAFIVLAFILVMPESPRWLVCQDRSDEAAQVISALYDLPEEDPLVADQLKAISAPQGNVHPGPLKTRTRTLLAVGIQVLSQFTGINIITYYAAVIYQNEIGLSPFVSRLLAAGNGTEYFIASLFSILMVKHFNRRSVFMFVAGGQAVTMAILAILMSEGGKGRGIAAAAFLFVFNTFFGLGYAQLSWLVPAEITPLAVRAQANALSTASNWIVNFLVVMITPICFNNIGWRTYLMFAIFNAAGVPFMYFLLPESKGRSLEEMDLIFHESRNLRDAIKLSFTMERHFDNKGNLVKELTHDLEVKTEPGMSSGKTGIEHFDTKV